MAKSPNSLSSAGMNRLYFGDNLQWLRNTKEFPDASVDLVYLDPPFEGLLTGTERIDAPSQINPFAMAARESAARKQTEML